MADAWTDMGSLMLGQICADMDSLMLQQTWTDMNRLSMSVQDMEEQNYHFNGRCLDRHGLHNCSQGCHAGVLLVTIQKTL